MFALSCRAGCDWSSCTVDSDFLSVNSLSLNLIGDRIQFVAVPSPGE